MNRRDILQLSIMAALAGTAPATPVPSPPASPKRGLGIATRNAGWNRLLAELRCKWFYAWTSEIPEGIPEGTSFVPMIWGYWGNKESIARQGQMAKAAGIKELLGFNEPEQKSQSNLSVEKALAAWPLLEETGLRLGSPGCVHPDSDWMKAFMQGAKKQNRKVDFVCVHSYGGSNPDSLVKKLQDTHKLYGKPIWITEFAVGDWEAKSVSENRHHPDKVLRFMEKILPKLDQLDFIERYAWFPAGTDNAALGTSALFDSDGKLTPLGECYRDA